MTITIKCFWCGAINDKAEDFCCSCRRKLQWSNFLKALVRPSVGCLLGTEPAPASEELAATATPQPVG
jgi:hypothetical protein